MAVYHIAKGDQKTGPFDEATIKSKLADGSVSPTDLCWTEGMANWAPVSQVFQVAPSMPTLAGGVSPAGPPLPKPETYMFSAILSTLLCCLPLGIVSIVHASNVTEKYQAGDYAGAVESSKKAKFWHHMSMLAFLGVFLAWLLLSYLVPASV